MWYDRALHLVCSARLLGMYFICIMYLVNRYVKIFQSCQLIIKVGAIWFFNVLMLCYWRKVNNLNWGVTYPEWHVTGRVTACITSIWVNSPNGHSKLRHFEKKNLKKILRSQKLWPPPVLYSCTEWWVHCNILSWGVTQRVTWVITSIWVHILNGHKKLRWIEKKFWKNSSGVGSYDPLSCGRCNYTVSVTWTGVLHPDLHDR